MTFLCQLPASAPGEQRAPAACAEAHKGSREARAEAKGNERTRGCPDAFPGTASRLYRRLRFSPAARPQNLCDLGQLRNRRAGNAPARGKAGGGGQRFLAASPALPGKGGPP